MAKPNVLQETIDQTVATIECLQREIQHLTEERDALKDRNVSLYKKLTKQRLGSMAP
ncbi:hypothetical protein H1230_16870 [Paenibacillus sp. 19GGS1-52]|uniref:hypothetical protein n=1 Tax=Paenibacillus sp. 19GGS1-52 TaxID=2758563 RepID=UPI001EFBCE63|nr:hypothetical protein [Paenibacillus sp. 19GGS1-52]ULO04819.1 hypothetical protein H1230_16870 [Paenibacillus sp. 19GGS1-52]